MGRSLIPTIEDYLGRRARVYGGERAIVADVIPPGLAGEEQERLAELRALAETAQVTVLGQILQHRPRPDPATFLGRGKAEEARNLAEELGADTLVVGAGLSPGQARNLEEVTRLKVIDRSQLILDIFAHRAGTNEAALAVELAQLEYLLPRLRGWGQVLTNPGAGVGTSGPGETRLEQGRRAIRRRVQAIRRELQKARQDREIRRSRRRKSGLPLVTIVGYTNSGKSTLFNLLAHSNAFVEDKLFATLDTRTRKVFLPGGEMVLLVDTVGFIRDLPHELVPAFHSTLESVREGDLLLLVLDAASPSAAEHVRVARRAIVDSLEGGPLPPILHVLNKIDQVQTEEGWARVRTLELEAEPHVLVCAKTGENLSALTQAMVALLSGQPVR